jgi:hypothetical protein
LSGYEIVGVEQDEVEQNQQNDEPILAKRKRTTSAYMTD